MINKTNIAKATVPCVIMLSIGFKPFVTIIPTSDKPEYYLKSQKPL